MNYLIPILGLALLGGVIYWVYRKHEESAPGPQRARAERFASGTGSAWRGFAAWMRRALGGFREWQARRLGAQKEPARAAPVAPASAPQRLIPPVRSDPALGEPAPVEQIASIPVPPDHAAAAARIASFEPEDDAQLAAFMRGEASAQIAIAEAWHGFADNCAASVGLDPAFVAGVVELGDVIGDAAHDVTLAYRRFLAVYGEILEQIDNGLMLPFKAREFLTGEGL